MSKRVDSKRRERMRVANAFEPAEVCAIAGITMHMLNYLARSGYLPPSYGGGSRGKRRYYSYRDLIIARIIARLLLAGIEISRLRKALADLRSQAGWLDPANLGMLITDGRKLYRASVDGTLSDLTTPGQLVFAFVVDVRAVREEVVNGMDDERRSNFDATNRGLRPAAA